MEYKKILSELINLRNKAEPTKGLSCDDSVDLYRKIDELVVDELNESDSDIFYDVLKYINQA